ncbi:MAG: TonB-dependent receptor, partial [Bacteroidota bacterium]
FSVAPIGLWNLARQYANSHISQFEIVGLGTTAIDTVPSGTVSNQSQYSYFNYGRINSIENQTAFDRNLRIKLGLDPNGDDFIYVDELDPSTFELDMYSADELLNQGQSLVSYYGYDYKGDRQTGSRPTIDDFFTETDENGNFTRPIGAFEPIYIAGYIMDKFTFDDIIFNVGLRVDRFDANQPVLKDQFVIGEALTVADTRTIGEGVRDLPDAIRQHPNVVGEDWVVYVNDLQQPTAINGYRDENTWYNAQGVEIDDPRVISPASGIAPLLADPNAVGEDLNGNAFEDYDPQWNVMPRISFSFPISDEAVFFAHYDVLTQRPVGSNVMNPTNYLFIQEIGQTAISNPNLRPTRTIDYELGFQQVLSRSSSLKIAAFYRETRDEIQVRNLLEAYPVTYNSFDNFDFGTIKGLTLTYDLRRTGNVTLNVAYTLQFASATGSNSGSAINLVNSGEPNLRVIFPTSRDQRHLLITRFDYRYGSGADYNGPTIGGKQILANTGLNIVGTLGSGTPYSQQRLVTGTQLIGGGGQPQLEGTVNGSRLPWQFNVDAQIDKSWELKFGKGEEKKSAFLNAYLLVNNLFNVMNITSVYRFTGNPDNDGYLENPRFQPDIENQIDPEAFRQLYALKVNDPFNFSPPRTIQLGLRLDF